MILVREIVKKAHYGETASLFPSEGGTGCFANNLLKSLIFSARDRLALFPTAKYLFQ